MHLHLLFVSPSLSSLCPKLFSLLPAAPRDVVGSALLDGYVTSAVFVGQGQGREPRTEGVVAVLVPWPRSSPRQPMTPCLSCFVSLVLPAVEKKRFRR